MLGQSPWLVAIRVVPNKPFQRNLKLLIKPRNLNCTNYILHFSRILPDFCIKEHRKYSLANFVEIVQNTLYKKRNFSLKKNKCECECKCEEIRSFLRICSYLLKKFVTKKVIFCAIITTHSAKMKLSIKDFFSKCDQIRCFLRIGLHLLKQFLMKNFFFCAVTFQNTPKPLPAQRITTAQCIKQGSDKLRFSFFFFFFFIELFTFHRVKNVC